MSIGKTILKLRKEKGLTQVELAEKLNVSDKAVSKWESENGDPSLDILINISKLFDVSLDFLVKGEQPTETEKSLSRVEEIKKKKEVDSVKEEDLLPTSKYLKDSIINNVLDINQLLKTTDNLERIEAIINKYPIHFLEYLSDLIIEENKRELYRYAVDNSLKELKRFVLEDSKNGVSENIEDLQNINSDYFEMKDIIPIRRKVMSFGKLGYEIRICVDLKDKFKPIKEKIIARIKLQKERNNVVRDISKQYLLDELEKGNVDRVAIGLCKKLEAILRCDFKYEGDLLEMLNEFCSKKLSWEEDDGWGYMVGRRDEKTISLLNKLRMLRNSFAHAEATDVELSNEELMYCINYICKLAGED